MQNKNCNVFNHSKQKQDIIIQEKLSICNSVWPALISAAAIYISTKFEVPRNKP